MIRPKRIPAYMYIHICIFLHFLGKILVSARGCLAYGVSRSQVQYIHSIYFKVSAYSIWVYLCSCMNLLNLHNSHLDGQGQKKNRKRIKSGLYAFFLPWRENDNCLVVKLSLLCGFFWSIQDELEISRFYPMHSELIFFRY